MTTLEDLWQGNIIPWEMFVRNDPQLKSLLSDAGENYDKLIADLTEKQMEILEKYKYTLFEMNSFTEQAAFKYGFSLGVRLMIESVQTKLDNNSV
ncbi:MAG: hypothetical protein K6F76_03130 [Clostridiales bacterium]|nr:hypothetical protein [Clostridiales bacterium]